MAVANIGDIDHTQHQVILQVNTGFVFVRLKYTRLGYVSSVIPERGSSKMGDWEKNTGIEGSAQNLM